MSAESHPINLTAFAEVIQELTLSTLYAKVAELHNSIAKLEYSNRQLEEFLNPEQEEDRAELTEDEVKDFEGYIAENEGVIRSMKERIALVKVEVENRGQRWIDVEKNGEDRDNDGAPAPITNGTGQNGGIEQQGESGSGDDVGVHL
ncbi:uncharacterized protein N7482_007560 [Penicillium canariense]|uniref:Uncharacterized protein n=1 Tax=Penicillium canariense TaxID=189055 RepID=A0A9W9HZB3_9EURO|nr:uncharacterized protein N7482_007560 [Penicillium canariense]KAJ5160556.1 hypothetical protein N7482_007560 [Penicillium canariense]